MDASHATPELFAALAAAQAEVENAIKTSSNPHFKSKYADLAEILTTARPIYANQGVSLIQSAGKMQDGQVVVRSILAHKSGGYITAEASCIPAKSDAQGIGAATTYLRRFSAAALYCIAQEDDDGNAASGRTEQRPERPAPAPEPKRAKPAPQPASDGGHWLPPATMVHRADDCKTSKHWNDLYAASLDYMAALPADHKKAAWGWILGRAKAAGYKWNKTDSRFEPEGLPEFLTA